MNACLNCANWMPCPVPHKVAINGDYSDDGEPAGECHSNPPHPHPAKGGAFRVWPVTRASDGCASGFVAKMSPALANAIAVTLKEIEAGELEATKRVTEITSGKPKRVTKVT